MTSNLWPKVHTCHYSAGGCNNYRCFFFFKVLKWFQNCQGYQWLSSCQISVIWSKVFEFLIEFDTDAYFHLLEMVYSFCFPNITFSYFTYHTAPSQDPILVPFLPSVSKFWTSQPFTTLYSVSYSPYMTSFSLILSVPPMTSVFIYSALTSKCIQSAAYLTFYLESWSDSFSVMSDFLRSHGL